jgi:hypothetical protein
LRDKASFGWTAAAMLPIHVRKGELVLGSNPQHELYVRIHSSRNAADRVVDE